MAIPNLHKKSNIGSTGLHIPALCFGTSALGNMPDTYGYPTSEQNAYATIGRVLASPMAFLDSSRNYGDGRSEQRIGHVVSELGGLPAGAIISTKLDRDMQSGSFDAARARESLEQSLQALNLSSVDILHLHDPEHAASLAEITGENGALPELVKMKEEGLCKAIGLAAGRVDIMMPLLREWDFDVLINHNRFTLVNQSAAPLFDLAQERNVCVLNAAPYAGGVFAKGSVAHPRYVYQQANETMLNPIRQIENLCARHQIPSGAAALQFSMQDPRIASTICGVSRPERVQQTFEWASLDIPAEFWEEFKTISPSFEDPEATREYKPG